MQTFPLVAESRSHSPTAVQGPLICAGFSCCRARALSSWHGFSSFGSPGSRAPALIVIHGLNCASAYGIFLDQGSNPYGLHWHANFYLWATREAPRANSTIRVGWIFKARTPIFKAAYSKWSRDAKLPRQSAEEWIQKRTEMLEWSYYTKPENPQSEYVFWILLGRKKDAKHH